MKTIKNIMVVLGIGLSMTATAQTATSTDAPWTLSRCIDYAIGHNISVKQIQNTRKLQALQLNTDKNSRLPDLVGSATQNFSFGRGLTAQNTYENKSTANTSFSIGSSVSLFDGMRTQNTIKLSRLNLDAADADLEKARNDLSMNVAKAYIEVLNSQEVVAVARRQVGIDSLQVERLAQMVAVGKASEAQLAQQRATLAQSRMTSVTAQNNYRMALLALSQLLELPSPEGFAIVRPDTARLQPSAQHLPSPSTIYAEALTIKPEVKAQQNRVEGADYNIRIARAARYPQLSLNGGLGSNYYKTSGFDADGLGRQLKNNFSQYIGLNLSVPIFNRYATRNNIRRSQISHNNEQLQLEDVKKNLYKEIQQVYYNAIAAASKYSSSQEALASNEAAFKLMTAKYENAKATITEFNEAKNALLQAESELAQAKYEWLYQSSVLNFYRGQSLGF